MLQTSTLKFLKDIKKNNNKSWMDAHRDQYLAAKEDFEGFVSNIISSFSKTDPDIRDLTYKDCIFRLNRDVRFSKDKSPYKSHFGAYFSKGGKKSIYAGYYFHLDPAGSFACGGLWMPEAPELKKLRQEIDYNPDDFLKIIKSKKFHARFGGFEDRDGAVLSRPPKGYDENNPAIEYIKRKSFVAAADITSSTLTSPSLLKETLTSFELLMPMIQFMNQAME